MPLFGDYTCFGVKHGPSEEGINWTCDIPNTVVGFGDVGTMWKYV